MLFPMGHLQTFTVKRSGAKQDPYNPDSTIENWDNAQTHTLTGSLMVGSSSEQPDVNRAALTEAATFTVPDPAADLRRGDMIIEPSGRRWLVQGHPLRNENPFTGWHPTTVAVLAAWQG